MKLHKRVLKLHQFRNLGKKSPTGLLLSFEKHGGLVVLVGENNVGKSNILEALKAFNDTDIKLCNEKDYFKAHEFEDAVLSLEEETSRNNETIDFSCVDLKIRYKEVSKGLKELSKTLISYPFEKHVEALGEQCSNSIYIPTNNNDYSNICTLVSNFINLIISYNTLKPFLDFYKEKLKLSELVTKYADATNNLLFKELIKHVSGNSEWIKNFCQCIKEIIKHNTPDKKYNTDEFFIMGQHKQNQLAKIYSHLKELSENEIKNKKDVKYISNKIKSLDKIFKTTDFTKFTPETEVKDIIKEIDEKYPINENFKRQFRTFRSNIISLKKEIKNSLKNLDKIREGFKLKKESWIKEIENYCKNQKVLEFNYDVLLDNIEQICKKYIASHAVNDASKDIKPMMCQFYLKQIDLLVNSEIVRYRYSNLFESARKSLWENIKTLDNESGIHLFPKNIGEIKDKFETNKEKFKQSKNYSEFAEYCRECNPYTAFQNLRNKQFPLSGGLSHQFDELVPTMKEYKEPKITDNDLKTALFTLFDYSSPSEFNQSDWFFRNSLFRKMDFHPNTIWNFFEIRIVEKETEGSAIKNHFNYPLNNASKDSDALDKIKRSLGVGQHVFHNPQKHRIVFVEGITDYCYLSAFKLHFNEREYKDNPIPFTFLPISGLKNNPNAMQETIKKLCELDNHPIVLIDDDRKCVFNQQATSERFKRANEEMHDPITILQLSDCDRHFKQIEDCFSANDRKKYAKNKQMELAMAFKTRLLYGGKDAVEKQTKRNFLKLFKWIAWATNLIKN
ncbi:hypothetical protein ID0170_05520 [Helicobacter pylori]